MIFYPIYGIRIHMKNNNNFKKVVALLVAVLFISGVSVANLGLVKSADAAGSKYSKSVLELQKCLPEGVALDTVVSTTTLADGTIVKTTVADTLKELGAKCSKGKLVDKKGKEIVFYFYSILRSLSQSLSILTQLSSMSRH